MRPQGPNHALLIGEIAGRLSTLGEKAGEETPKADIELSADDKGNYLDTIRIRRASGWYRVTILPEAGTDA